ncbi:hypothetical protein B0A52_08880 [Exophiala mesophila]|uniref:Uncharacterized protein n=1 Tax=Exophiala mesophila TaxID=212818 RepID=A0A438MUU7_EXOME|nr:hypothetical protein B0A52_08880 [Exophiala mesophila]
MVEQPPNLSHRRTVPPDLPSDQPNATAIILSIALYFQSIIEMAMGRGGYNTPAGSAPQKGRGGYNKQGRGGYNRTPIVQGRGGYNRQQQQQAALGRGGYN